MPALAVGANENLEFHAHVLEAHPFLIPTCATVLVLGQATELVEHSHVVICEGGG